MAPRLTVAATMIVRNEAAFLGGCLDSLASRVDDIVIVDTGSTDGSVDIARAAGVRLLHHPWTGRFCEARNVALAASRSDWVLYIDADERLRLPEGGRLADYIEPRAIAGLVSFRPKTGYTRYREWRLFRNDPRLRFSGGIHETMKPAILAISRAEGLPIVRTGVMIDHLGYDADQSGKHARNLPLLETAIAKDPERSFRRHHLAEVLEGLGRRDEAIASARQAITEAALTSEEQRASVSLLYQFVARTELDRGGDPRATICRGLTVLPENYSLWFLLGWAMLNAGEPLAALRIAEALLRIDPDRLAYEPLAFNRDIFGGKAAGLAAAASFRLGRAEEALAYARQAAVFAGANGPAAARPAAVEGATVAYDAEVRV